MGLAYVPALQLPLHLMLYKGPLLQLFCEIFRRGAARPGMHLLSLIYFPHYLIGLLRSARFYRLHLWPTLDSTNTPFGSLISIFFWMVDRSPIVSYRNTRPITWSHVGRLS